MEEEYEKNNEGSYIVESSYAVPGIGRMCWDATRYYHQLGRYINHAQKPNAAITPPHWARGKWRIGFVAVREIKEGDEVVWDYGIRGEEWSGCRLVDGVVMKGKKKEDAIPIPSDATSSDDDTQDVKKEVKKVPKRRYVYCPVETCTAPPLKKVSQHLRQYHNLPNAEVKRLLKAKRYATRDEIREKKRKVPTEKKSSDIKKMFSKGQISAGSTKGKEKEKAASGEKPHASYEKGREGGTRQMGQHSGPFFDGFMAFLMSRSGGKKSERNAKGISANVAKFLYWCNPTEVETSQLTQAKQVRAYIAHLEGKIGPSGLQQHISDNDAGLRYLVETKEGTEEEERLTTLAGATSRKLKDLRASFRGEKASKERQRLEDLAEDLPSTEDVCEFLQSQRVSEEFKECCSSLSTNPTAAIYNTALVICAGRLLYR